MSIWEGNIMALEESNVEKRWGGSNIICYMIWVKNIKWEKRQGDGNLGGKCGWGRKSRCSELYTPLLSLVQSFEVGCVQGYFIHPSLVLKLSVFRATSDRRRPSLCQKRQDSCILDQSGPDPDPVHPGSGSGSSRIRFMVAIWFSWYLSIFNQCLFMCYRVHWKIFRGPSTQLVLLYTQTKP